MIEGVPLVDGQQTSKVQGRIAKARARETKFLMSFDLRRMNRWLLALLSVYIALNFLDALTTLMGIQAGPSFIEHNPIAAGLFRFDFPGFVLALGLKYLPVLPFSYGTLVSPREDGKLGIRIVKLGTLVALAAANLFYLIVVGSNSITLYSFYN
jgi:hypothetical protein